MYLFWKKNQTGNKYYCLGENKSINGKTVRVKEIYLGTANRIYELLYSKRDLEKINTYEYGLTIALLQVVREFGLYKILKDVLPFKVRGVPACVVVVIVLLNKVIDAKSKNSLNQWYKRSILCKLLPVQHDKLSSQLFFDCFKKLNEENINKIEYKMAKNVKKVEDVDSILCDMTSVETYIQYHEFNMLPQRGRSKTGKKGLRLVNVALLITRQNSIPLFHISYPGNVHDVTEFKEIVNVLEKKYKFLSNEGRKKITVFIDKGNNSEENINGLEDAGYYFVGRLRPSAYENLLAKPLSKFKDKYAGKQNIKSYSSFIEVYGRRRKVVVTFNKESYEKSYEEFMDLIERRKTEIKKFQDEVNYKLRTKIKGGKAYWQNKKNVEKVIKRILEKKPTKKLFSYDLHINKRKIKIEIKVNRKEFDKRINLIGKYILFTNRKRWNHNEIIKAFLDQYLIENQYKTLKGNRIKIKPLYHWTDDNIRADIFLSILSLQLMNLLLKKVKKKAKSSDDEILNTLEKIKVSYYKLKKSKHNFELANEMEKEEQQLYEKLNLKDKNTFSYIKRAFL